MIFTKIYIGLIIAAMAVYTYTTHNKLRIFGYGFKFFGELYMSCTNDFVCDHSIVLWYEMYLFGVVSFIVFAWHACKEQGGQNNKITQCIICYCGVHLPIFLV